MGGNLQELILHGRSVTADDLQHLPSSLTSLRMTLSYGEPGACVAQLERLTALQELQFANNSLCAAVEQLAASTQLLSQLRRLSSTGPACTRVSQPAAEVSCLAANRSRLRLRHSFGAGKHAGLQLTILSLHC